MRFRNVFISIGGILTILLMFLTDPDGGLIQNLYFGSSTVATLVILLQAILYVGLLHYARKALFDYIDFEEIYNRSMQSSQGAGYFGIAVGLAMIAIAIVISAAVN